MNDKTYEYADKDNGLIKLGLYVTTALRLFYLQLPWHIQWRIH